MWQGGASIKIKSILEPSPPPSHSRWGMIDEPRGHAPPDCFDDPAYYSVGPIGREPHRFVRDDVGCGKEHVHRILGLIRTGADRGVQVLSARRPRQSVDFFDPERGPQDDLELRPSPDEMEKRLRLGSTSCPVGLGSLYEMRVEP